MDKCPCTRDCPRRSADCHCHCPDYSTWLAKHKEAKEAERKQRDAQNAIISDSVKRNAKAQRERKRRGRW